jgi:intein/homing endonuclease
MGKMNWDYIAGFIDGEGSFFVSVCKEKSKLGFKFRPEIGISNCYREVLDYIAEYLNAFGYKAYVRKASRVKHTKTPHYKLTISDNHAVRLAEKLSGYLVVKAIQAEILSQYGTESFHGRGSLPKEEVERRAEITQRLRKANALYNSRVKVYEEEANGKKHKTSIRFSSLMSIPFPKPYLGYGFSVIPEVSPSLQDTQRTEAIV